MKSIDLLEDKFTQAFYERNWSGKPEPPVSHLSIMEAYTVQDQVTEMKVHKILTKTRLNFYRSIKS